MALNNDCLLEICQYLKKEDLLSLSKIVCRRLEWNDHLHTVEKVRCYRLQNVCGMVVQKKFSHVKMESVGNQRQFVMAFREDIKSLTINIRLDETEETEKLIRGVTSKSVMNLEIIILQSANDFICPYIEKLHRFMSQLHINFPELVSLQIDYRPKSPMICPYTGGLRGQFRNLRTVTLLGFFAFDDWGIMMEVIF